MSAHVYTTTDDAHEARLIAEKLWAKGRRCVVMEVLRMPDPPRTTDRYAVLIDPQEAGGE